MKKKIIIGVTVVVLFLFLVWVQFNNNNKKHNPKANISSKQINNYQNITTYQKPTLKKIGINTFLLDMKTARKEDVQNTITFLAKRKRIIQITPIFQPTSNIVMNYIILTCEK